MNKAEKVVDLLNKDYPDVKCGLDYDTHFQLLVATILSAQSTDKSVNKVTADLFKNYPDVDSFLELSLLELETKIKKIGLYRNKSKSIYKLCRVLKDDFHGQVPSNMEDLMILPGVGRKTASVVLAEGFKIPAFPVDTHVFRITRRIGITQSNTADKVSDDMMNILPKNKWIRAHHLFITHGRETCIAKKPKCEKCSITDYCLYYKEERFNNG